MSAGFLSEAAPHSLRTILAIPCVVFFMLVFAGKFIAAFNAPKSRPAAAAVIAVLMLAAGALDFFTYFSRQARDPRCWEDFSTQEYSAGLAAKKAVADGWHVEAAPCFVLHPSFNFALYKSPGCNAFDLGSCLPAASPQGKNLMYLLPMEYMPMTDYLQALYPDAAVAYFKNKYNGAPIFFYFTIPADGLKSFKRDLSANGVNMACYAGHGFTGASIKQKMPCIILTGLDNPEFNISSASWSAKLEAQNPGEYGFDLRSHGYAGIYMDGKAVVLNPSRPGSCDLMTNIGSIYLKKGIHRLNIKYETNDTASYKQGCVGLWLFWKKPGEINWGSIPGTLLFPD
jgi:hypothetical protein